jgi:hypothetical protein
MMTGLDPGTTYTWSAYAVDEYGAVSSTVSSTFTTRTTTAPSLTRDPPEYNIFTYENRNNTFVVDATDAEGDELSYSWFFDGVLIGENSNTYEHVYTLIGNHTITVLVSDGFLNNVTHWNVTVKMRGDVNGDCIVDIDDLASIGMSYRSTPGDSHWFPDADINGDGKVSLMDLVLTGYHYRRVC